MTEKPECKHEFSTPVEYGNKYWVCDDCGAACNSFNIPKPPARPVIMQRYTPDISWGDGGGSSVGTMVETQDGDFVKYITAIKLIGADMKIVIKQNQPYADQPITYSITLHGRNNAKIAIERTEFSNGYPLEAAKAIGKSWATALGVPLVDE